MYINDAIAETFGAYANMMAKNTSPPLSQDDVLLIFKTAHIKNSDGSNDIALRGIKVLAQYAVEYWREKDKSSVVVNIEQYFASVL